MNKNHPKPDESTGGKLPDEETLANAGAADTPPAEGEPKLDGDTPPANVGAAGVPPVEEQPKTEDPRKIAFSKKLDEILRSGGSNTTKRDQIIAALESGDY